MKIEHLNKRGQAFEAAKESDTERLVARLREVVTQNLTPPFNENELLDTSDILLGLLDALEERMYG